MNTQRDDDTEAERAMKQLFAHAKPRPLPPPADTEEIRRAVFAEWDAVTGRRVWARRSAYAAAASVLLAAGLWFSGSVDEQAGPGVTVARVERMQGSVAGVAVGGALSTGARLTTGEGQVALRLASGGSLRVGANSEVVLTGPDGAELVAGAVYFDSERQRAGQEFTIETALGSVRDVGTQFLVNVNQSQGVLDVGVREGLVVLTKDGESGTARAGERLVAERDATALRRDAIATFGGEWAWAERLAPPFDIDGRTVGDFLAWFAAQTGRSVVFANPDAERLASETTLRGSIDLEPLQKLSAVLATTELTYRIEADRVVIDMR
jgi:hypothetical protein